MSGGKFGVGAFALFCAWGMAAEGRAQGIVPGGWAPQVGYQTFGTTGFGGGVSQGFGLGASATGFGVGGYGFAAPTYGVGYGGFNPYSFPQPVYGPRTNRGNSGYNSGAGQTVSGMDPLIGAIRQSTRRRKGR